MKNSTIIGISVLAVAGTGFYFYSKGKKSTTTNSTVTTPTPPTDDIKLLQDLGVKIEEPKVTPYVKPMEGVPLLTSENIQKALLALNIDQTRSLNELSSPNYITAKKLASDIQYLSSYKLQITRPNSHYAQQYNYSEIQMLSKYYGSTIPSSRYVSLCGKMVPGIDINNCFTYKLGISKEDVIRSMTAKLNGLGYKLLPNFDIEKM